MCRAAHQIYGTAGPCIADVDSWCYYTARTPECKAVYSARDANIRIDLPTLRASRLDGDCCSKKLVKEMGF